ncbi:hypothetical protein [Lentzea indica]|uniref:hypothetical protein n=1 Tax=Lentzea indica TaxID=2604800 RepID=UPI00143ABCC8|nr:hypothetical protein [Lentzea indica]
MTKKQTMMPLPGGGKTGRRLAVLLIVVTLVALVIRDPIGTATAVRQLAAWGGAAVDGFATFVEAMSP